MQNPQLPQFSRWTPHPPQLPTLATTPNLSSFRIIEQIQRARNQTVYFTMRVLFKRKVEEFNLKEETKQQIFFLQGLKHPNLLNILTWFEDPKNLYLITDVIERQSLASLFKDRKRVEEEIAAKYFFGLFKILNYLYLTKDEIFCKNINLNNVYILPNSRDVVLDLFFFRRENGVRFQIYKSKEKIFLKIFEDKENLKHFENEKETVLEIGKLMYSILVGIEPNELYYKNNNLSIEDSMVFPAHLTPEAKSLLKKILVRESKERANFSEIIRCDFFRRFLQKKYCKHDENECFDVVSQLRDKVRILRNFNNSKEKKIERLEKKLLEKVKSMKEMEERIAHLESLVNLNNEIDEIEQTVKRVDEPEEFFEDIDKKIEEVKQEENEEEEEGKKVEYVKQEEKEEKEEGKNICKQEEEVEDDFTQIEGNAMIDIDEDNEEEFSLI